MIKSFTVHNYLQCISECSKNSICSIAIIDSFNCKIYKYIEITDSNTIYSLTSSIYLKKEIKDVNSSAQMTSKYLIHYWPFNGNYDDVISNANLFNGINDELVVDRFGRSNSSLYLNYGQLQAPNGVYIYGDFTLTTWVKMYTLEGLRTFFMLRLPIAKQIFFSLSTATELQPYFTYKNGNQMANASLIVGKWQHLAFTNQETLHSIYIDGFLVYSGLTTSIDDQNRASIYFGTDLTYFVRAEFDDIKIYNKSLTQNEIVQSSFENF